MDSQSKPRRNVIIIESLEVTNENVIQRVVRPWSPLESLEVTNENVIQRVVRPWSPLNSL